MTMVQVTARLLFQVFLKVSFSISTSSFDSHTDFTVLNQVLEWHVASLLRVLAILGVPSHSALHLERAWCDLGLCGGFRGRIKSRLWLALAFLAHFMGTLRLFDRLR